MTSAKSDEKISLMLFLDSQSSTAGYCDALMHSNLQYILTTTPTRTGHNRSLPLERME